MALDDSASERWRPVFGWEGHYEVSDLGRVRSLVDNRHRYRPSPRATLRPGPRFTADDASAARELAARGQSTAEIARRFGMSWGHAHRLIKGPSDNARSARRASTEST